MGLATTEHRSFLVRTTEFLQLLGQIFVNGGFYETSYKLGKDFQNIVFFKHGRGQAVKDIRIFQGRLNGPQQLTLDFFSGFIHLLPQEPGDFLSYFRNVPTEVDA